MEPVPRRSGRKQTKPPKPGADVLETKYLIVGNSVGAVGAVEAIRQIDQSGSLTVLSDEPHFTYSRPMIAEYLAGQCSLDQMLYRAPDFYEKNRVRAVLGRKAVGIDFQGRLVELDDRMKIGWRKLLLATGGRPIVPKMDGVGRENVFTFTTIADAEKMKRALPVGATVVVIGGGLIGISVTQALVEYGARVIVVELMDRLLSTMLDPEGSHLAEEKLQAAGVRLVTGQTVSSIIGRAADETRVGGVILQDGQSISCDAVVVAIGVIPRTELVEGSPIAVNRGIVVDRRMQSSVRDVYACGDVAEAFDFVQKAERVIPVWPNAYIGGRVAGQNMAGLRVRYPGGTAMNSLNWFGLSIVSAGVVDPGDVEGYEILSTPATAESYRKIVLKKGRVVGMIFLGEIEGSGVVFGLMKDGVNVSSFKEALLRPNFGLSALPDQLRWEMLGVVPVGQKVEVAG
jgi:NAD(P)H-nitrite reductase large subunit